MALPGGERGGEELVKKVAKEIADITGATLKFTEFILAFDPGPPKGERLIPVDWTNLRRAVKLVYAWRSRALHRSPTSGASKEQKS